MHALLVRWLAFTAAWLVLSGGIADAAPGAAAALAAAALSLRLLPARPPRSHPRAMRALLRLLTEFVRGSVLGGVDVARRALHPRLPVQPGWVRLPSRLPAGPQRLLLEDLVSLMPGSLTAGASGDELLVHCLHTAQPPGPTVRRLEIALRDLLGKRDD